MEIERLVGDSGGFQLLTGKQRKSPENGDWKISTNSTASSTILTRNKENLLKMEIESTEQVQRVKAIEGKQRKSPENGDWKTLSRASLSARFLETKKISWKWRLKVGWRYELLELLSYETKKISWKWRLKVMQLTRIEVDQSRKQRKSPENGDWKTTLLIS